MTSKQLILIYHQKLDCHHHPWYILSLTISWFSFFILRASLKIWFRWSLLLRSPNLASCALFLAEQTADSAFLFAWRYFSISPPFCYSFQSRLFSLMTQSTASFHHHVSFRLGLPARGQPQAVSLALSRQVLISFQALSEFCWFWKDCALSWTQFPNCKGTSGSDNFHKFRFGGIKRDLLNVVFNSRSPTSRLCWQTHSSLPITRTDLKSLFWTKI